MSSLTEHALEGIRILVVEDNLALATSLCWALESLGATVVGPARSCEEALQSLQEHTIDVAILDSDLRGVPSTPVAMALQEAQKPIVVLTGFETSDALPAQLRGLPCLRKPVDPFDLAEHLLQAMAD